MSDLMKMEYNHEDKAHRLFLAGHIIKLLNDKGFVEVEMPNTKERVFEWRVTTKDANGAAVATPVRLLIYTSVDKRTGEVRKVGIDAIRVCGVRTFTNGEERGCIKRKRVNRTGKIEAILDRMLERCRTAYTEARTAYHNPTHCRDCGAMNFVTKADKTCCSDLCWTKKAGYQPKTKAKRTFKRRTTRRYGRR